MHSSDVRACPIKDENSNWPYHNGCIAGHMAARRIRFSREGKRQFELAGLNVLQIRIGLNTSLSCGRLDLYCLLYLSYYC